MGGTYRAWNDTIRRWPPPNGWYRAHDGRWWAPGTGPNPPGRTSLVRPPSPTHRQGLRPATGAETPDDGRGRHEPETTATRTRTTALLPMTASPTPTIMAPRRKPRLITRVAIVMAGTTLGAVTVAAVLTALITTGRIDEFPGLDIGRPETTTAASSPSPIGGDPAPIEPWTSASTNATIQANVSEPRLAEERPDQAARFPELFRVDEVADGPRPSTDARPGLAG